ncbi:uncharacterized protein LOC109543770 [Dendroctonus ponderosae]|uniref:uncharacterized protein LOC109543770 n=1 Tax=Dendroctonus ponderosae TaxID=77166 RepID=UPI002035BF28|nr:uncharacterized protein LOC109543770 [Dendroctonus ponderosae]KAH1018299.1 hypothetical protein HUJ05_006099 [Dendroctonus ponderosae]
MVDCIEKAGKELNVNNQDIVKYLCGIEEERRNLENIIQKQYQERKKIEADIERLTYKLCLINKSLSMRIKAKNNYDKTIEEIKSHYDKLVDSSNKLKQIVEKSQQELDDIMNKKTGTSGPEGEEVQMLYMKPTEKASLGDCSCTYAPEKPTKQQAAATNGTNALSESKHSATDQKSTGDADNAKTLTSMGQITDPNPANGNKPPGSKNSSLTPGRSDLSVPSTRAASYSSRRSSTDPSTSREDRSRPASQVPAAMPKMPAIENSETTTVYHMDKRNRLPEQTDDRSKNLLLSRLKTSISKGFPASVATPRESKTVAERNPSSIDHRVSDAQANKLQKRSLHDILSVDSSPDAKQDFSQIL